DPPSLSGNARERSQEETLAAADVEQAIRRHPPNLELHGVPQGIAQPTLEAPPACQGGFARVARGARALVLRLQEVHVPRPGPIERVAARASHDGLSPVERLVAPSHRTGKDAHAVPHVTAQMCLRTAVQVLPCVAHAAAPPLRARALCPGAGMALYA